MKRSRFLIISTAAAVLAGTVACSPRDREEISQTARTATADARQATQAAADRTERVIDDSVITAKIKSALLADSTVKGLNINVDTAQGTVTLSGNAHSPAERAQAESVAASVEGVRRVVNQINVS